MPDTRHIHDCRLVTRRAQRTLQSSRERIESSRRAMRTGDTRLQESAMRRDTPNARVRPIDRESSPVEGENA
jgi:hypothetical protein